MKISHKWLNDYVDIAGMEPEKTGLALTMHTAEVEEVENLGSEIASVVIAKVNSLQKHPDADKLNVCSVDDGENHDIQVVCGAPNVREGGLYPFARTGCVLPGNFKIKKTKIRGVESFGMLMSRRELGIGEDHDGLWELNEFFEDGNCQAGSVLIEALDLSDAIYTVDNKSLTHRPDLWGHLGIARELAAIFGIELKTPEMNLPEENMPDDVAGENNQPLKVIIEDSEACLRYSGAIIEGVNIKPSPEWMQNRLNAVGQRPINNVVDATNYVMLELGQPLHAFDADKFPGRTIKIRRALEGEKLTTLDDVERKLQTSMLMIADADNPVALAGVMGGASTEVSDSTRSLVLESACFEPACIRRTATGLGLRTEAANRYEKFQDPENTTKGIRRFLDLIKLTCPDAHIVGKIADEYPGKLPEITIKITGEFIRRKLGAPIEDSRIEKILTDLGFILKGDSAGWTVMVPTYRATKDVSIPEDLVEEVGRTVGYDNIPIVPPPVFAEPVKELPNLLLEERLRDICVSLGLTEIFAYSLTSEGNIKNAGMDAEDVLKVANPLSQDADRLRVSLVPEMLRAVSANLRHQKNVRIFELGRTYKPSKKGSFPDEHSWLCGMAAGSDIDGENMFECREMLRTLLSELRLEESTIVRDSEGMPFVHPGRSGAFFQGEKKIGVFAEIHPRILKAFDIKSSVAFFQIQTSELMKAAKMPEAFPGISKYPVVPFDVAVVVPENTLTQDVELVLKKAGSRKLKEIKAFDIYRGPGVPEDHKSIAFSLVFGADDHTLGTSEVESLQKKMVKALEKAGYTVRKG